MQFQRLGSLHKPHGLEPLPRENATNQAVVWTLRPTSTFEIFGVLLKIYWDGLLTVSSLPTLFDFVIPNADCSYQYKVNEADIQYSIHLKVTTVELEG